MKRLNSVLSMLTLTLVCTLALVARAQPAAPAAAAADPTKGPVDAIKGTIDIKYNSRLQVDKDGNPTQIGAKDVYVLDFAVLNTLVFQGQIEHTPTIFSSILGREKQAGMLNYNLTLQVRNPANLSQTRSVGKLVGTVPIDTKGVYIYDQGNLRMAIEATGSASGFESKFRGRAAGKPPKNASMLGQAKQNAKKFTRKVKGQTVSLIVTRYDEMDFTDLVLAAGPVKAYPEMRVNGKMTFDYDRYVWFFEAVTMSYTVDGKTFTDKLSGNIKWVEDPQRETNGKGRYEFDVRFNEPELKSDESAVFKPAGDESDFFTTDPTLSCLTGVMEYVDTMREKRVLSSKVKVDLKGNNLTKNQQVGAFKLLQLVDIVPLNAE